MEILVIGQPLTIGQRARLYRVAHGWRQADLAAIADVPQGAVSALERDCPVYPAARRRILETLGLDEGAAP